MVSKTTNPPTDTARDPLDAPVGWIAPEVYANALDRMRAYRWQLIANEIKPDLEKYRSEEIDNAQP